MARTTFRAAACTVILSAWSLNSAFAQTDAKSDPRATGGSSPASGRQFADPGRTGGPGRRDRASSWPDSGAQLSAARTRRDIMPCQYP